MVGTRKKEFKNAVDDFGKEVNRVVSRLPKGNATNQFIERWKALRKQIDDVTDKLPD